MKKIQSWDKIIVMRWADKGKVSTVTEIVDENYIIAKDIKIAKKGVKGQGFIEKAMPIHVSNVMLYDEKTKSATRVGIKMDGDKKVRISKKSWEEILKSK